ncbi:hypothetical protein BGZ76_002650, partial [Entomortierella beljakovae]
MSDNYRHEITLGDEQFRFSSISGLEAGLPVAEYDGEFLIPSQDHTVNITLTRVILGVTTKFFDWINSDSLNSVEKKDLTISLTDESGIGPTVTWTVTGAIPIRKTTPVLDATRNEVMIEEL